MITEQIDKQYLLELIKKGNLSNLHSISDFVPYIKNYDNNATWNVTAENDIDFSKPYDELTNPTSGQYEGIFPYYGNLKISSVCSLGSSATVLTQFNTYYLKIRIYDLSDNYIEYYSNVLHFRSAELQHILKFDFEYDGFISRIKILPIQVIGQGGVTIVITNRLITTLRMTGYKPIYK